MPRKSRALPASPSPTPAAVPAVPAVPTSPPGESPHVSFPPAFSSPVQIVLDHLILKSDIDQLLRELEQLRTTLYQTGSKFEIPKGVRQWLWQLFEEAKNEGIPKAKQLMVDIESAIKQLTVFEVTVAWEPTQSDAESWVSWLKHEFGAGMVLQITVNPNIVGGAQVSYGGKYFDGSLRKAIRETLAQHMAAISAK